MSAERADRLAALVGEEGLDQLIVGDLVRPGDSGPDAIANARWLTGFTGTSALVVIGPEVRKFMTDFRYAERAEKQVGDAFERVTAGGRLIPELAALLAGRVGFDDTATSVANLRKLEEELGEGVELVPVSGLVERLRRRKDAGELELIAEAARIADDAYETVLAAGLAGRTEAAVAAAAHARIRELGAEPSFMAIVAAGPNGALPHAEPSERRIGEGELVVWDMGAMVDGYASDCTRTFAVGEIPDEARDGLRARPHGAGGGPRGGPPRRRREGCRRGGAVGDPRRRPRGPVRPRARPRGRARGPRGAGAQQALGGHPRRRRRRHGRARRLRARASSGSGSRTWLRSPTTGTET